MLPAAARWLLAAGCLFAVVAAASLDQPAATWAADLPASVRRIAGVVTAFGTSGYMIASAAVVALAAWWNGRRSAAARVRHRLFRLADRAAFFLAAIAVSGGLVQALKHVVGRARPRVEGAGGAFTFHPFSISNAYASFPSGHATSAFAAAAALGLMLSRGRLALFAAAAAIGVSRVLVGAHYPSDVVAGAVLGTVVSLALAEAPAMSGLLATLRAWWGRAPAPGLPASPARTWVVVAGSFLHRHRGWCLPALASGCFAIAVPPADLFGSEWAEHVKDACAILIALAGLTVRALVVGFDRVDAWPGRDGSRAPTLWTTGPYALCRNPLDAGTILIFLGIFLMHGNRWTVLFGSATYLLAQCATVAAEEDHLLAVHGAAYADYRRRVPRWLPDWRRLGDVLRGAPLDLRNVLNREYPVIGMTVIALALAEFYEEIEEPLVGGQVLYVELLGVLILGVAAGMATVWLAKRSRAALGLR